MRPIIRVEGLGKRYRIGAPQAAYNTLRETISGALRSPFKRFSRNGHDPTATAIWALRDVSFEVTPGEVVGIIGRNGAGKSTLLKILSRITEPTTGEVDLYGRVGSLLEVGTGFHPELSGRENIYLNGAILGMRREEIECKFDEIVAFAGVEKFLDTPVKQYSSGMFMRLAFSVAAHLEPEILLVDEVLAVGDAVFQKKCLGKMRDVAKEGRTVLFVSHNMAAVSSLCSRAILLTQGALTCDADVQTCLNMYASESEKHNSTTWKRTLTEINQSLYIDEVSISLEGEQPEHHLNIETKLVSQACHKPAYVAVDIHSQIGATLMQSIPTLEGFIISAKRTHTVNLKIELPPLVPGRYEVSVWVGSHNTETLDWARDCVAFEINQSPTKNRTFPHSYDHGYIVPHSSLETVHS